MAKDAGVELELIPIAYDPHWVEQVYLPKHIILCDALKRGAFPYV